MEPAPDLHQNVVALPDVDSDPNNTKSPFRHVFRHRGRKYTIFKRSETKDAPYYIHVQHLKYRHKKVLETNIQRIAIERAKKFIDSVVSQSWDEVRQSRNSVKASNLQEVFDLYDKLAVIDPRSIRTNKSCMMLIVAATLGEPTKPRQVLLSSLTPDMLRKYQMAVVNRYVAKVRESGTDPDLEGQEREARERALRTSMSTIHQARSLFTKRHDLVTQYSDAGLIIPPNIDEFMTCKLLGKRVKSDYLVPPDTVVKSAFKEIEKLRDSDPHAYIAFWFAVGAGLRRREIQRLQWEHIIERDGFLWVSGGIGKDGERIEVPIQTKAVEKILPLRKTSGRVLGDEVGLEWANRLNTWMRHLGWQTEKKLHELRAYVGSLIYRQNPVMAMKFMRHKSIAITERFYCRYGTNMQPVDVL